MITLVVLNHDKTEQTQMNQNNETQDIELSLKEAQEIAELGEALEKLEQTRAFKKVILEGYLKDEAVRLVHAKANPEVQLDERKQKAVDDALSGIANLQGYFYKVKHQAYLASEAIKEGNEELDRIREEELGE